MPSKKETDRKLVSTSPLNIKTPRPTFRVLLVFLCYRGTSLTKNAPSQNPAIALCLGTYGDPGGEGRFLMAEVPPYTSLDS